MVNGRSCGIRRKVICSRLVRPIVVEEPRIRRCFRCSPRRYVYEQGFLGCLPAGIGTVDKPPNRLVGLQTATGLLRVATAKADDKIGSVELPPQGVCVLAQDLIAHIVDQVVLCYRDERGRSEGPLDPNFPDRHGSVVVWTAVTYITSMVWVQQCVDEGSVAVRHEALSSHRSARSRRRYRWRIGQDSRVRARCRELGAAGVLGEIVK